eukprot:TRINITY_DN19681_c0_g2_i1.p1 TRINITY_DN19681_c0_g2~~TRINITY_DN19681_c0_g2_i1.p1  ORF type:complete len:592 (+),score=94.04 TRINITY_DN19681_c0_g2_i1:250-2025(+)
MMIPVSVDILAELFMCVCLSQLHSAEHSFLKRTGDHDVLEALSSMSWYVFGTCALARLCFILGWKLQLCGTRDSVYAASFMFFSCVQWVVYLASFYCLAACLIKVEITPTLQISQNLTYAQHSFNACNEMVGLELHDCLLAQKPHQIDWTCSQLYDPKKCIGFEEVRASVWDTTLVECCVLPKFALQKVSDINVFMDGLSLSTAILIASWLGALTMSWTIQDLPFLPHSARSTAFVGAAWIDILDSIIFSKNLETPIVMEQWLGVDAHGYLVPLNRMPVLILRWIWIVAFLSSILAPIIYTWYRYMEESVVALGDKEATVDTCLASLSEDVHQLKSKKALNDLNRAIELQRETYAASHVDPLRVIVYPKRKDVVSTSAIRVSDERDDSDESDEEEDCEQGHVPVRAGRATWDHGTKYRVVFDEDEEEKLVDISLLDLDAVANDENQGSQNFDGWLDCEYLRSDDELDQFDRRARLLNALRVVFLLDIPFAYYRWYWFDVWTSPASLLLFIKNILFTVAAILLILACGRQDAHLCGYALAQHLSDVAKGPIIAAQLRISASGFISTATTLVTTRRLSTTRRSYGSWKIIAPL